MLGITGDEYIRSYFEGNGCDQIEVLSQNFPGGTEKNGEEPQGSLFLGRVSKRVPPEYKSRRLPLHQPVRYRGKYILRFKIGINPRHAISAV
jgi:hypothetical protein